MSAAPRSIVPRNNNRFRAWLGALWPAPVRVDGAERLRACIGAGFGLLLTALVSRWLGAHTGMSPWLVAPMGASAVLIFAVPASPLAQPWAVVGGNTVSAIVGMACALAVPDPAFSGPIAVGLAIGVMFLLRCLHPPGGASALLVALSQTTSFEYAAFPVLANSVLMVVAGMLYNSMTGRPYPHTQAVPRTGVPQDKSRFSTADLDAALAHYNQVLDVSRDDLEALLHEAEKTAYQRNLGELRCADVMTRNPVTVAFGTPLDEAWALMRKREIKALPVIDRADRIVGIVTVADFMRHADTARLDGIVDRLRALVRPSGATHTERPEVVGQIMTRQVRVTSDERYLIELVPLFSQGGHHHIPVINADQRLVGIITQSDLVGALYRAVQPEA